MWLNRMRHRLAVLLVSRGVEEAMSELKACPFCGSNLVMISEAMGEAWARCVFCRANSALCSSKEEATRFWNARYPASDAKDQRIAELEEVIAHAGDYIQQSYMHLHADKYELIHSMVKFYNELAVKRLVAVPDEFLKRLEEKIV